MNGEAMLEKKISSTHNKLDTAIIESIKSLMIINQYKLEYIVYKLLKNSEHSMNKSQILDELCFLKELDIKELDVILSYYDYIHYNNFVYYYSKEEKSTDNNLIDIVNKTKYLEQMDTITGSMSIVWTKI